MDRERVSRNDPCPCGSGKKYKHCCLRKDVESRPPRPAPTITDIHGNPKKRDSNARKPGGIVNKLAVAGVIPGRTLLPGDAPCQDPANTGPTPPRGSAAS